jgi:hypothetical protein
MGAGSFDWLDDPREDVYSQNDGDEIEWPNRLFFTNRFAV